MGRDHFNPEEEPENDGGPRPVPTPMGDELIFAPWRLVDGRWRRVEDLVPYLRRGGERLPWEEPPSLD